MKFLNIGSNNVPIPITNIEEIKLDIDSKANPDIVADARELYKLPEGEYDGVWCSHLLEHFYEYELPIVIKGVYHVLKSDGIFIVYVPDLLAVMKEVIKRKISLDDCLYVSPMGKIRPIDVLYGYQDFVKTGNLAWAHKTGFDKKCLKRVLVNMGFQKIYIRQVNLEIQAVACKTILPENIRKFFKIGETKNE